ncbi:MAG TPA: phosphoglycerate kinase [Candidatus Brocadiia bacterium]|nr:phosphoglycerate kinase [Candidatus Brocadiia bacterium]
MKKMTISDIDVAGKRVLVRADFNVPFDEETKTITNDRRIIQSLPTIRDLLKRNATVILMSHFGRPKGKVAPKYSLEPIRVRLAQLLGRDVAMLQMPLTEQVIEAAKKVKPGEVALLENTRFVAEEEANDEAFAKNLAKLGDVFVMDAFGTAHRAHASTEGVARILPAVAGLLVEKEIKYLGGALSNPKKPFVAVLGGAKVDTKLGVIENLMHKVDSMCIGGAMAYPFLKAKGAKVGASLAADEDVELAKKLLAKAAEAHKELLLPVDHVCGDKFDEKAQVKTFEGDIPDGWIGLDIGPQTATLYAGKIESAGTVIWNGPMGKFEWENFSAGTKGVAKSLAACKGATIVGGGETAEAVEDMGMDEKVSHVSTGGGACLEFLEGKKLPGIEILKNS